ncbi:MAG TPA: hypothetical protein VFL64_14085 [Rhizobacter sp.]|nr:hypothetical protein [Rhizobacter sp.]
MSVKSSLALFEILVTCSLLHGCSHTPLERPDIDKVNADFYWPYAAIASNVYATGGAVDVDMNAAFASEYLRAELRDSKSPELAQAYINRSRKRPTPGDNPSLPRAALPGAYEETTGDNKLEDKEPKVLEDCNYEGSKDPSVPVHTLSQDYGWTDVPELNKYPKSRRWSFFIPDLAIDVWRRKLSTNPSPMFEYAIVYRGTVGSGGWFTNFRGLAAFTPAIWDQYLQAQEATTLIINQIYNLHTLSDELFRRAERTKITITAVGHSLGAGLAQYAYLKTPQIDKVVGFDPSPLNGSSLVPLDERAKVMRQRAVQDGTSTIFLLNEYGEMLTSLAPCVSGPIWGDEGGPIVSCSAVNLSRGNPIRQHNMPQLACKLYVARTELANKTANVLPPTNTSARR